MCEGTREEGDPFVDSRIANGIRDSPQARQALKPRKTVPDATAMSEAVLGQGE
jgi:hypothetical protein